METFKEGQILCAIWGYSMRLVSYWKVTKVTAHFATVIPLASEETAEGFLTGTSVPIINKIRPHGEVKRAKIHRRDGRPELRIESQCLRAWDGSPQHFNHCD